MIISPIKIQGKKTKLVPEIIKLIPNEKFVWIEPFLGSGEVLFNVNPEYAVVCDNNGYIINFFKALQQNKINEKIVREFLEYHGERLNHEGKQYYYKIRDKFNKTHGNLEFLFLNRSCFNGIMRFNNNGEFNVPFCNKDNRFTKALITKIVNQVNAIQKLIIEHGDNWKFICCDWKEIEKYNTFTCDNIIYYFDPPYIDRHSTYFDAWTEEKNNELFEKLNRLNNKFLLSNWLSNKYRRNLHIEKFFDNNCFNIMKFNHYYHVGAKESNRNSIIECIVTNFKAYND